MNAVVLPEDFDTGLTFYEVSPSTEALWRTVLVRVQGRWLSRRPATTARRGGCGRRSHCPGTFWLIALFLVPFYAVMAVAFSGNINIFGEPIPAWNPLDWQFATFKQVVSDSVSGPYQAVWIRTAIYSFWALVICVARRVSRRVLHGSAGREAARPDPGADPRAVVDQLHHPDARLGQPAAGRRLREQVPRDLRRRAGLLAGRQLVHRRDGARLRLPAVLHHPAVRLAGPDRPAAARGVARPRRRLGPHLPARDACRCRRWG